MSYLLLFFTIFLTSSTVVKANSSKITLFSQLNIEKNMLISEAKQAKSIDSLSLFNRLDTNDNGQLSFQEFITFINQ